MIITIDKKMQDSIKKNLLDTLYKKGFEVLMQEGIEYDVLLLTEGDTGMCCADIRMVEGVIDVFENSSSYHLASREFHNEDSIVRVNGCSIGGKEPLCLIAGPCAVESKESIETIGMAVKEAGVDVIRGGAFKPRTSPYAFQGLGFEGVSYLVDCGKKLQKPVICELTNIAHIDAYKDVDIIQIGARNMQNYELLKAVGKLDKPVLLKRGMASTVEEWILAAEYILKEGNPNVIFCERGIRTFEKSTRNTLDVSSIAVLKEKTHLPVIVDPSHAAGNWKYVKALALAGVAAGADGVMVEVHTQPENALSDGAQSLTVNHYEALVKELEALSVVLGRKCR